MITIKDYKLLCHLEALLDEIRSRFENESDTEAYHFVTLIDKDMLHLKHFIAKLENANE